MNAGKNKTILFIPRWYPYPEDEMYGLFIRNHAETLAPHFQIVILYAHPTLAGKTGYVKSVENGISTYRYYFRVTNFFLLRPLNPIKYLMAVSFLWYKIKRNRIKIDLCHVHVLTRTALLPLWLKFFHGIPFIVTEHWSRYLPQNKAFFRGFLRKLLTRFAAKQAYALTAVTEALLIAMKNQNISNQQSWVIPNVVDTNRFTIKPVNQTSSKKTLLHVGCFDERAKNIKGLLRVAKQLKDAGEQFTLKLVGTGADWQETVDYAKELGLTNHHVVFTGLLTGQLLVDAYQECTALVLFSHYETQGVVLLEAFACGKPVVASNTGGIPEVMSPERGILVEPENENELFELLKKVLHGHPFADAEEIRGYAVDHFSEAAIGQLFGNLYLEALKN